MYSVQDTTEVSIGEYLEVLRRRWLWIAGTVVVLVGLSLLTDLRAAPQYQASTQMLLQAKTSENILVPTQQVSDPQRALQNELRIINSRTVKVAVAKAYGSPIGVRAIAGGEDDVIVLQATATTGREAARRANVYASTYQDVRLDAILADLSSTKTIVQQQVDDFQAQINKIDEPLVALDDELAKLPTTDPAYDAKLEARNRLKSQTDAERAEAQAGLTDYTQRLQILQISERLATTGGVQVLNPAVAPSTPVSPTPVRDAVQSLVIGLFLGVGLAFVRDQFDDSLRTKADLERAVKDLPTIGMVPLDPTWRDARRPHLATIAAPMSAAAESYRGLRTAIQYAALERPMNLIQITSSGAGEGKTTLLSNLALAFAQAGKRVCVVGCDLRKPRLHQFMQVDGSIGFTSVVLGDLTLAEAVQQSPIHPNISVLASGPRPPNPSELLSLDRSASIIRSLTEEYSVVFLDCPPVLPVTDALVLSRVVDATIFLASANRTSRRTARRGVEMLRQVSSPLLGTVLNGVAAEDTYGSLYEYYGYVRRSRMPIIGRFLHRQAADVPVADFDHLPEDPPAAEREPIQDRR
ncbi:polysaccharide biosynthesis tyrosine autokinase [Aquihabitans sp. G128]|uniref:polysaccharide biosynthesis tyrosine autokinase n=1 Tax=Aquihabitans sp. G128 TaxID=2849779 RepID=UPI001C24186D|nr:polysaccharide biosynthesis tyrosine autokinase [Aquihabitans sp. G128]QXC60274.1 polysaccharide biosynthesis tyrosine autokinase [Aquihabitans sp. G128]